MILTINNKHFNPSQIVELNYDLSSEGEYIIFLEMVTGKEIILKEGEIKEKNSNFIEKKEYFFIKYIKEDFDNIVKEINNGLLNYLTLENSMRMKQQSEYLNFLKRYGG